MDLLQYWPGHLDLWCQMTWDLCGSVAILINLYCVSNGGIQPGLRYTSVRTGTASECPGLCPISGWWRTAWVMHSNENIHTNCGPDIRDGHWYGGPEELVQHFPMRPDNQRRRTAYLPGDMLQVIHLGRQLSQRLISGSGQILWGCGGASVDLQLWGGGDGDGGAAPVLRLEPGQQQQTLSLRGAHGALCER